MAKKYYAGIGSRKTPFDILKLMTRIANILDMNNFVLRSGHAIGADQAFEKGALSAKEIFVADDAEYKALEIASTIHPAWERCDAIARKLHARNIYQVMGKNIDSPVDFVICWTENGLSQGGTRTAIVYSQRMNIPVFNLGSQTGFSDLKVFLKDKYAIDIDIY